MLFPVHSSPPNATLNWRRKPRNGWKPCWAKNSPRTFHLKNTSRTVKCCANSWTRSAPGACPSTTPRADSSKWWRTLTCKCSKNFRSTWKYKNYRVLVHTPSCFFLFYFNWYWHRIVDMVDSDTTVVLHTYF